MKFISIRLRLNKFILISAKIFILVISIFGTKPNLLNAEDSYLNEIEIDDSTKFDTSSSDLPTNPFEIVEMLRRANSMYDATPPSNAIVDAVKSFMRLKKKKIFNWKISFKKFLNILNMIKNPIQEVTNKLQYRAIGIVKGIYKPMI